METTHTADPICHQTVPDGSALGAEPFIDRRLQNRNSLSGPCHVGRDAVEFCDSSVPVPSIKHSADAEQKRYRRHHRHQPSDREPHAEKTHGSSLDTTK
jgi:hypothetical protein